MDIWHSARDYGEMRRIGDFRLASAKAQFAEVQKTARTELQIQLVNLEKGASQWKN